MKNLRYLIYLLLLVYSAAPVLAQAQYDIIINNVTPSVTVAKTFETVPFTKGDLPGKRSLVDPVLEAFDILTKEQNLIIWSAHYDNKHRYFIELLDQNGDRKQKHIMLPKPEYQNAYLNVNCSFLNQERFVIVWTEINKTLDSSRVAAMVFDTDFNVIKEKKVISRYEPIENFSQISSNIKVVSDSTAVISYHQGNEKCYFNLFNYAEGRFEKRFHLNHTNNWAVININAPVVGSNNIGTNIMIWSESNVEYWMPPAQYYISFTDAGELNFSKPQMFNYQMDQNVYLYDVILDDDLMLTGGYLLWHAPDKFLLRAFKHNGIPVTEPILVEAFYQVPWNYHGPFDARISRNNFEVLASYHYTDLYGNISLVRMDSKVSKTRLDFFADKKSVTRRVFAELDEYHIISVHQLEDEAGNNVEILFRVDKYRLSLTDVDDNQFIAEQFSLSNYPNPFNPETTIFYSLPESGDVELTLYNVLGQQVKVLYSSKNEAGEHTIRLSANDLSAGIYFVKLDLSSANSKYSKTIKLILSK